MICKNVHTELELQQMVGKSLMNKKRKKHQLQNRTVRYYFFLYTGGIRRFVREKTCQAT